MALKARTLTPKRRSQEYDRKRGNSSERGYDAAWQRFRAWYASVHPAICKACGHAGVSEDMHLDHVVALARGGDRLDSNNVQWLCQPCHSRKTWAENSVNAGEVIIVVGPPGAGKTTWVSQKRKPGDLVWDADVIAAAISGHMMHETPGWTAKYLAEMRAALVQVSASDGSRPNTWIITATSDDSEVAALAASMRGKVVVIDPGEQVCIDRVSRRRTYNPDVISAIREWYKNSQK